MSKSFLTNRKDISPSEMAEIKQNTINKWEALGFLKGLNGIVKKNIADLYESEASHLLNETPNTNSTSIDGVDFGVGIKVHAMTMPAEFNKQWAVYIVECSDGTLYTGISNDVNKRILTHNKGKGAKYTKTRLPVSLKYVKSCEDRSDASKEEYRIKKLTKLKKIELIDEFKRSKGVD